MFEGGRWKIQSNTRLLADISCLTRTELLIGLLIFSYHFTVVPAWGDATWEFSVQVSASVQSSPPQIILSWPQDTVLMPSNYIVYRKLISDTNWGTGVTLTGETTNYVDANVSDGSAYEYQIVKTTSQYHGYGYIYAGVDAPLTEFRGKVLLLVDNTYADFLSDRLSGLEQDLVGDGWTVLRHDISPSNSVAYIKALIQADYRADPTNVNTVFLFGHIPVPYSGDIAPDGHVPNHVGAWPADVYYADMAGTWTDVQVSDTNADDPRNWNVPGDGKFDQSSLPAPVQLMVGRVDLSNMPGQPAWEGSPIFPDEPTLLANYLDKDHNYRHKVFDLPRMGLVGDYLGNHHGEAFAASGWRNFAPFFGASNVTSVPDEGTWLPTLGSEGFLWSYACGSGAPDSIGGVGNDDAFYTGDTQDFYNADVKSAFVMLFGSWFGDWDSQDNLMRAVLATPDYGLACMWSGRPHWYCHHMGLGQTIGYCARLTQNNGTNGLYQNEVETNNGLVHVALMGDPTLRMHTVAPVTNLTARSNGNGHVQLAWDASADSVVGYYVYRSSCSAGSFARLNNNLVTDTTFNDANPSSGSQTYMVRAIKLETTASGTYFNASQGIFVTATVANPAVSAVLNVSATTPVATRIGLVPGVFTVTRSGDTSAPLTVYYSLAGSATAGADYQVLPFNPCNSIIIPSGATSTTLTVNPLPSITWVDAETAMMSLQVSGDSQYSLGPQSNAIISLRGNGVSGISLRVFNGAAKLSWPGAAGRTYRVEHQAVIEQSWIDFGMDVAGAGNVSWNDPNTNFAPQRFYRVFEIK